MDEKKMGTSTILTPETWPEYLGDGRETSVAMLLGYRDAIVHRRPIINKMLETAKDFNDLKAKLTAFVNNENAFIDDLDRKWTDALMPD